MKKKLLSLFISLITVFVLASCTTTSKVEWIEFKNIPASTYNLNQDVYASDFYVTVKVEGSEQTDFRLNNSALTVQGLINGKLDTKTAGEKVLKVTYKGTSVSAYYTVIGSAAKAWTDSSTHVAYTDGTEIQITSAGQLAKLAADVNTGFDTTGKVIKLMNDIDLENRAWTPIGTATNSFKGSFISGATSQVTIKNLKVENGIVDVGLFGNANGGEYKNIKFDRVTISIISGLLGENSKNFAALIGRTSGTSTVTIDNVDVMNATVRGNGRISALIGQSNSTTIISNCDISNSSFSAYNPVIMYNEDGEGDKVGSLVGQSQATLTLNTNTIKNVTLSGTRDMGGLVGHASKASTVTGNSIDANTTITATAYGGFRATKVSANAGGLIGTINPGFAYVFDNNTVSTLNIECHDSMGSKGKVVGGIRRDAPTSVFNVTGTDIEEGTQPSWEKEVLGSEMTFDQFKARQLEILTILDLIN